MEVATTQEEQTPITESEALTAGFNDDTSEVAIAEVPQEEPKPEVEEEAKTEEVAEEVKEEAKEPETVSITAEQWNALQARLTEIDSLKAETTRRIDQTLGKYGELNRTIQQIQQKPQGGVNLSQAKFTRLKAEFPELATLLAEDLSESFTPAQEEAKPTPASIDPAELEQRFQSRIAEEIKQLAIKNEVRELTRRHKDWNDVVRSEAFNQWGSTLPQQEWEALRSSVDADEISRGLDTFKEHQAKVKAAAEQAEAAAQKKQSASKRLEAAITPTGTAGSPVTLTERDMFLQGFKSP